VKQVSLYEAAEAVVKILARNQTTVTNFNQVQLARIFLCPFGLGEQYFQIHWINPNQVPISSTFYIRLFN